MSDAGLTSKALGLIAVLVSLLVANRKSPHFLRELMPHLALGLIYIVCWCVALIGLAFGIRLLFGAELDRSFIASFGSLLIGGAALRIPVFWEHPKAEWLRQQLGDTGAMIAYVALGASLVALAVFGPSNMLAR